MSRIHEALKRAEQERATFPVAGDVPVPEGSMASAPAIPAAPVADLPAREPEIPHASEGGAILEERLPNVEPVLKTHADQFLRFEDIWNSCVASTWNISSTRSVFGSSGNSAAAEQFRTLRSRLYQLRERTPLKAVLVTSALVAEGKTFVASNLAQALARQKGCKVLLIDADLRCSNLHSSFGTSSAPGLSDYLASKADLMKVIQKGIDEQLCFIPGGTQFPDPAELLANGRLKHLLAKLAPVFDWVIIDSPPTLPVADSMLLADLCDGVVCVVRAAYTDLASAQKGCQQLQQKGLLGVVLNCADEDASYGNYYTTYPARALSEPLAQTSSGVI